MDKQAALLNEARIPFGVRDLTLEEEGAPKHLVPVIENLVKGKGNFFDGVVLTATQGDNPSNVIQAFAVIAKEVTLGSMDALYITPLQLIAILENREKPDLDPRDVDQLFVDTLFIEGEECPYTLREKALLREFFQRRKFDELSTSVLSFGPWSRSSQWYDRIFVNLFRDHAEVTYNV